MNRLIHGCILFFTLCALLNSAHAVYTETDLPCVLGDDKSSDSGWDTVARSFQIGESKCSGVAACDIGVRCDHRPTNQDRVVLSKQRIAVIDGNSTSGDLLANELAQRLKDKPATDAVPETQNWLDTGFMNEAGACFAAVEFLPNQQLQVDTSGDCTVVIVPRINIASGQDLLTQLQADNKFKCYGGVMEGIPLQKIKDFMKPHHSYPSGDHVSEEALDNISGGTFSYWEFLKKQSYEALDFCCLVYSHSRRNWPDFCLHVGSTKTLPASQIYNREGPVRIYLFSDGICIHPLELIYNTYDKSCPEVVQMVEAVTTQRMKEDSASCGEFHGLSERFGLKGQAEVESLSCWGDDFTMDETLDKAVKFGWLIPAAKDNRSFVVMDIGY
ncbi:hypothetical protein ACWJJH_02255 [Endozoicomonadaceae bacterium StTr2]